MNALLAKFDEVVIENNTQLSESDREYCEQQHKLYTKILKHYRIMFEKMQQIQKYEEDYYMSIADRNEYQSGR